jgi:uroporphyrinogen-III synthase
MTLHALVTRPEEDAAPLAVALAERGIEVTVEPLLTINPIPGAPIDLDGVQAVLFTSANGVRSFAALAAERNLPGWRALPAFAVGDASASVAREAGFAQVESAGGDVAALARLVIERLDPNSGALFHAAGSAVAGDLAGSLDAAGFVLRREMLYEAKPADHLSPATVTTLANGGFDLVLFFSPRTAATFVTLTRAAGEGVVNGCASTAAVCLSPAVAAAAGELPWREVKTAARPELAALLDLIDHELAARARSADSGDAQARSMQDQAAHRVEPMPAEKVQSPMRARRSRVAAGVTLAVVVALIVAGLYAALPNVVWDDVLTGSESLNQRVVSRLDELDRRLQEAERGVGSLQQEVAYSKDAIAESNSRVAALESAVQSRQAAPSPNLTGLMQRLDKLESAIAGQSTAGHQSTTTVATSDLAALAQKIAALETRVAALQVQPEATGAAVDAAQVQKLSGENTQLRNDLQALKEQLDALDQAVVARRDDAGAVAFVLAVGNLGSALSTARPFAAELSAVTELAAKDPALSASVKELTAPLAARAANGVPTLLELRARFPAAARAIVDAAKQEEQPAVAQTEAREWYETPLAWLASAGEFVTSQVSVRPVGDVPGDDPGARVARAEVRLSENALDAAVAELEGLTGAAAAAAGAWLDDARARLAAERAVAALQAAAVTRLGSGAPAATDAGG